MIGAMVGSYKVTEMIGEGGMGAVYKGIDVMLEREVAIKMLRPELSRQPNLVERFRSEAVTLAKLNHPNIATLYSFLRQGDDFFMVMEYVRGETIDSYIRRTGAMQVQYATRLFCRALEGIEHAHEMGIIHRDIKPANMMLTLNGSIKVMDFGIARMLGTSRMTRTGHLIGTIEYMSPEQVKGEETDARSDIYSLGMLLYEMLTGRLPFTATSEYELMRSQIEEAPKPPTEIAPHIPIAIEQAIMRALAKRPDARLQTARHFRAALEQSLGTTRTDVAVLSDAVTIPAPPPNLPHQTPRPASAPGAPASAQPAPPAAFAAEPPKETRLQPQGSPASYQRPNYPPQSYQQPAYATPQQAAPPSPSLLSRLNWKHYTSVGALLVSLIALPVVLLSGASRKPEDSRPVTPAPTQVDTPTPPSTTSSAPLVGPNTPTAPIPTEGLPGDPTTGGVGDGAPKSNGQRDAGRGQPRETRRAQTASESDSQDRRATPAQPRESQPRSNARESSAEREQRASRADDGRKNKGTKIGEATEAVGGAIKKLGGLFGKKKDDKKH